MNILAVGDVHGCFYTFKKLVETHFNPKKDFLVQVGDLFTKGKYPAQTVEYAMKLQKKYPYQVFFLMGNHELRYLKLASKPGKNKDIARVENEFLRNNLNVKKIQSWIKKQPLKWETPDVLITHAGVSKNVKTPFSVTNSRGVLHNRSSVKNVGKVQVYGHKMQSNGQIVYKQKSNAWCIDSGAWLGNSLSALKLKYSGVVREEIQIKTLPEDL